MITLCCIKPEARELLNDACEAYCKFKGIADLPENVYGAFYWLMRYSGLVTRAPAEHSGSAETVVQQTLPAGAETATLQGNVG